MPNFTHLLNLSEYEAGISDTDYTSHELHSGTVKLDLSPERANELLIARERLIEMQKVDGLDIRSLDVKETTLAVSSQHFSPDAFYVSIDNDTFTWIAREGEKSVEFEFSAVEIENFVVENGLRANNDRLVKRTSFMDREPLTNAYRASQVDREIRLYADKTGLDITEDGPDTAVGDTIAGMLHWVEQQSGSKDLAVKAAMNGLGHYLSETFDPIQDAPSMDFQIQMTASNHQAGVEVDYTTGYPTRFDIDDEKLLAYSDMALGTSGPKI